jgi:hypothetical protein
MHAYMIEEMAEAISQKLHIDSNAVLLVLHQYWENKIALTWDVRDMLNAALNVGKPITKADAVTLLYSMLDDHDPVLGVSWQTLEIELEEYHLDWNRLTEDQYDEVQGVFQVWRKGDLIAQQAGLFPKSVQGNLPKAIALAKSLADQAPEVPILIGCEPRHSGRVEPWLSMTREKHLTHINEKEA